MKEEVKIRVDAAFDALKWSRIALEEDSYRTSINRAYYGALYCAQAFLTDENIAVKSHKGVWTKFNEHFVKTKKVPRDYGRILSQLENTRERFDYNFDIPPNKAIARGAYQTAMEFYKITERYFRS